MFSTVAKQSINYMSIYCGGLQDLFDFGEAVVVGHWSLCVT